MSADELKDIIVAALRGEAQNYWHRGSHNLDPVQDRIGNALDDVADQIERLAKRTAP